MFRIGLACYLIFLAAAQPVLCCCSLGPFAHSCQLDDGSVPAPMSADDFPCCERQRDDSPLQPHLPCQTPSRPAKHCPCQSNPQPSVLMPIEDAVLFFSVNRLSRTLSDDDMGLALPGSARASDALVWPWDRQGPCLTVQFHLQHAQDLLYVFQVLRC